MQLRALVPAMAAMAAIPAAQAFEVQGDDWSLSIEPRIQTHLEIASASDAGGDDHDIWAKTSTEDPQSFNFYVRRARIYTKGKNGDGFFFGLTLEADKIGLNPNDNTSNDAINFSDAFIGKSFSSGDTKHKIQFGLDELGDAGPVAVSDSSSKLLFPNARNSVAQGNEAIGFIYSLSAPVFGLTVALGEAEGKAPVADDEADLYFAFRVFSGLSQDMALAKRSESFLGKDSGGLKHQAGISLEYGMVGNGDITAGGIDDSFMGLGIDYLVHFNQLTGLLEFNYTTVDEADFDGMSFTLQGGYAIPLSSGKVVEPALRITYLDNNTDADEAGTLDQEGGDSGMYVDLGVNYYIDGHSNKVQAGIQIFTPEEGDGDAFAFRLAHCIDF